MNEAPSTTDQEATITRVFEAPRALRNVDDPSDPNVEVFTTTLVDLGDGTTQVTYHQVGHMPTEEYTRVEEGVNGFHDRLAEQVARR